MNSPCSLGVSQSLFLDRYSRALQDGNAALFVGAGTSMGAGLPSWGKLFQEEALRYGLHIEQEHDYLALAQYICNASGSRAPINQLLIDKIQDSQARLTRDLQLLAQLPVQTVWTTNYDDLLEQAYEGEQKRLDVKVRQDQFAATSSRKDVTLYKMHGDQQTLQDAVLTTSDYDQYNRKRKLFSMQLSLDLATKTFLFVGFSFTDPNIHYILSRVVMQLQGQHRDHFAVLKRPERPDASQLTDTRLREQLQKFEYETTKLWHQVHFLKQYGIQAVLIDHFSELTTLLETLQMRVRRRSVFVSGAAYEFQAPFERSRLEKFSERLGRELIKHGYNLVSGVGIGLGGAVIVGTLEALYQDDQERIQQRMTLRPFPQQLAEPEERKKYWTRHRQRMLSKTGFSIYLSGNKQVDGQAESSLSDGMLEEFELTQAYGGYHIPVGATGFVARLLHDKLKADFATYYPADRLDKLRAPFDVLGDENANDDQLMAAIFALLKGLEQSPPMTRDSTP